MINSQINDKNIKIEILLEFSDNCVIYEEKSLNSSPKYYFYRFNQFNSLTEYIDENSRIRTWFYT